MKFSVTPGLTTTNEDWRQRISELKDLKITETSFFPTCLRPEERQEAYLLLEKAGIVSIPLVHLRSDMNGEEIDLLKKKFNVKVFNIHSPLDHRFQLDHNLTAYRDVIYIENSTSEWKDSIADWAGICLDVTHLEAANLKKSEVLADWQEALKKYRVGVWHVSAIHTPPFASAKYGRTMFDVHYFNKMDQFDYITKYKKYRPEIIALELENTISEQLKAVEYVEKKLR